ncbi:phosphate transport system regulatory protein PhoU [Bifidobacterium aemilianum]|uniref:Phosphate-specific transport system accessory protein PhoU n=1 Tax=Bifidobacterium aemilianum TaxID=2493120 RepID=A0A366K6U3_9BIFI|nr:phosphate signaling complex protein PhoU [Bifidobacterium aemilianum]RBP97399.1 phosphate transport system regulatory protein PhoU [Bifidobacterium aemilianum]
MRVIFNEELKAVGDGLDQMAADVSQAVHGAGQALLNTDLDAAQAVIDGDQVIDDLEADLIDQCVRLLARQNPVATDLRVVVSSQRLAATFERMGDLSRHIAEAVRRSYPNSPLPPEAKDLFRQMQEFLDMTADRLVTMLADRDTKTAEQIIRDDSILDDLHHQTFALVLDDSWQGSKQELIDVVLLGRFMERMGDHAVSAARRVVYIVSGFDPSKEPDKAGEDNEG